MRVAHDRRETQNLRPLTKGAYAEDGTLSPPPEEL